MEDDAIRDVVLRLSRPALAGGHSVEHAVLVAEGSDCAQIVAWILAHGGTAEAAPAARASRGLHGPRDVMSAASSSAPQRYMLPADALA